MPSLTLKQLPRELHRRLKARAVLHQRSLNKEAIACLKTVVMAEPVDTEQLLATAQKLRSRVSGYLTDDVITELKVRGRP